MLTLAAGLAYVSIMIVLANAEQMQGRRQPLAAALHYGLAGVIAVWIAAALAAQTKEMNPPAATGFILAAGSSIALVLGLSASKKPWRWIDRMIARLSFNERPGFDRHHRVHQLAVILMIFQAVAVIWPLVTAAGPDFAYANPADALVNLATGAAVYTTVALLGVGWPLRRNARQVLQRLGLRLPNQRDWGTGLAVAVALHIIAWAASSAWASLVAPDTLQEQTAAARQLFDSFNSSLILAALFALLTAVSEEILFRGALQPVFGLALSSLFFTWLHLQYAFTPGMLILFIVSLGFGLLRHRVSTTASIIAHSIYNFVPFFVSALPTSAGLAL